MSDVLARAAEVLGEHGIECTGLGEVTCRGCRHRGWMTWTEYRRHVAQMLADAGLLVDEPPAPNLIVLLDNATPEQAEVIFGAAMDAAFYAAPQGVVVGGAATLAESAPVARATAPRSAQDGEPR